MNSLHPKQRGFSLVEVLITLVIMGIAGLYVTGIQAGRTSLFRHHAVTLAGDVADRIRANPNAAAAYEAAAGADNGCVDGGLNCTSAEMAANDILLWRDQAQATLPGGDVAVDHDGGVFPPTYEIEVSWTEPGENMSYVITIPVRVL